MVVSILYGTYAAAGSDAMGVVTPTGRSTFTIIFVMTKRHRAANHGEEHQSVPSLVPSLICICNMM